MECRQGRPVGGLLASPPASCRGAARASLRQARLRPRKRESSWRLAAAAHFVNEPLDALGDLLYVPLHIGLDTAGKVLVGDTDDSARIDQEVGEIPDALLVEAIAVLQSCQLVVGGTDDHLRVQLLDSRCVEGAAA